MNNMSSIMSNEHKCRPKGWGRGGGGGGGGGRGGAVGM